MDESDFLRNAALKLCGSLNIEEALHSALVYIRRRVPADAVFLLHLDPALDAMRTIAKADLSRGQRTDIATPLRDPRQDDRFIRSKYPAGEAIVTNAPLTNPFDVMMIQAYGYDESSTSLLGMMLFSDASFHGGVMFVTEAKEGFADDHAHLICVECGSVREIPPPDGLRTLDDLEGFEVRRTELELIGLCPACAKKRREKEAAQTGDG